MEVKVSLIIPVYNVEDYLEKCLDSVLTQTLKEIEIIIVNDGSTDGSLSICKKYTKKDKRVKLITQQNKGLGGARNTGIINADGDFIFLLDSDDYIKNNTIEDTYNFAIKNNLDLVVFNYDKVDKNNKKLVSPKFGEGIFTKNEAFKKILSLKTSPQAWNKLYKRNLFTDNSILYPEKFLHEDLPVTYKLFWHANKIGYLNESYYFWLVRNGSITQNFTYKHINDIATALLETKKFLNDNKIYEIYENEYIRGSIQMLNILIERSILFSTKNSSYQDYVKYIIDSESIVNNKQILKLFVYDKKLHTNFMNNYEKINDHQNTLIHKISVLESQLSSMNNLKIYRLMKFYSIKRDKLLPIGSKRRQIIKNILNRK